MAAVLLKELGVLPSAVGAPGAIVMAPGTLTLSVFMAGPGSCLAGWAEEGQEAKEEGGTEEAAEGKETMEEAGKEGKEDESSDEVKDPCKDGGRGVCVGNVEEDGKEEVDGKEEAGGG